MVASTESNAGVEANASTCDSVNSGGVSGLVMVDTHAHLTLEPFDQREVLLDVLSRSNRGVFPEGTPPLLPSPKKVDAVRVAAMVVPATNLASSQHCVALAHEHAMIYAAVGIHPNECGNVTNEEWERVERLSSDKRVVAIGETGLDRHWKKVPIHKQKEFFQRHLTLAEDRRLPVLIHCREAWDDLLPVLRSRRKVSGVLHAFSGDSQDAKICLEAGLHISFAGSLTYQGKKFVPVWEAARLIPDDRLLIETDSPFLVPNAARDVWQHNEPLGVAFVAAQLAELRHQSLHDIITYTTQNARRLFRF